MARFPSRLDLQSPPLQKILIVHLLHVKSQLMDDQNMSQFNPGGASGPPQVDSSTKSVSKPSQNRPGPGDSFACDQCPKVFNRRENLSRHQKTRRKPVPCSNMS